MAMYEKIISIEAKKTLHCGFCIDLEGKLQSGVIEKLNCRLT